MSNDDPFAPTPVNDPEKVTVTIKAPGGPTAPWVVFRGSSNAEVADLLGAAEATGLFAIVAQASGSLAGHFTAGAGLGATPIQAPSAAESGFYAQGGQQYQQQPQAAQQPAQAPAGPPPGVAAPACPHGTRNYVPPGTSKSSGKPYSAFWGCPAQQGDPSKCRPQWVK